MKREDNYYEAMRARDPRFDGKFFVGVKTTGIYCRPICPAKPKRENVEFFRNPLEAERAGYRPCLRCRPESAPRSPAWIGKSAVVRRAVKVLNARETLEFNEDQFAALFGVTARHLRRLFAKDIGKTPKQLSFENRLNLTRKLITETQLPITEIAFASGFRSLRRFNAAFKNRFKRPPVEIRRLMPRAEDGLKISLSYRPPFDFEGLMKSYQRHRIGNLEWFENDRMHRVVAADNKIGHITLSNDAANSCLIVEIKFPDTTLIPTILSRVRNLFDLDSDPILIANVLETNPQLKMLLKRCPGIRLPSGWDPFEIAVSTILGQLVSVEHASALVRQLIELAGSETRATFKGLPVKIFPTPKQIVAAPLSALKTTNARRQTLIDFSQALIDKEISLEPTQDVEAFIEKVQTIRGIGAWTAHYIALKALRSTDTFPPGDLILSRVLKKHSAQAIDALSPWKGYVAALFWRIYVQDSSKNPGEKKWNKCKSKSAQKLALSSLWPPSGG